MFWLLIYITSCTGGKLNFRRDFVVDKCNYANRYNDTFAHNLHGQIGLFKKSNFCPKFIVNNPKVIEVEREN
jgi:hypothetical protein